MSDGKACAVLWNALERMKEHEAEWLQYLREEVSSYDLDGNGADDGEVSRMDEIQTAQAFSAQELLRDLMQRFEGVVA
ncbi:hypothetical protein ABZ410_08385 [Streptomyces cinnamoneus]|uniref:hypothetical protein n=1 Tax=Streptomyces cinnamoneus TaxID=53446 RepID=UPI0033FB0EE4